MIVILLALFYYIFTFFMMTNYLSSLDLPMFVIWLYVMPLIINVSCLLVLKKHRLAIGLLLSSMAIVSYTLIGYFTKVSGVWLKFIQVNSHHTNGIEVTITSSLVSISQIAFAVILYFSVTLATYYFYKPKKGE